MKKAFLKLLSLALCAAMLCAAGAAAAEDGASPAHLGPVQVWGTAAWTESGSLFLKNSNESDPNQEIIVHLSDDTVVMDAVSGLPLDKAEIRDGDTVYAWVGPAMTMSLPPQSTASVVVANIPADYAVPQYCQIAEIQPQAVIAIYPAPPLTQVTLTSTGGKTLTIPDSAELVPYLTKNIVKLEDLVPGTEFMVWSDAQGTPKRVMVFPYAYRGYMERMESGQLLVNGQMLDTSARTDSEGIVMLPIRATAEALGLEVFWESGKGAVVKAAGETVFTALPGREVVLPGGEEAPYGVCAFENGVTYLPESCLLSLLNLFQAG